MQNRCYESCDTVYWFEKTFPVCNSKLVIILSAAIVVCCCFCFVFCLCESSLPLKCNWRSFFTEKERSVFFFRPQFRIAFVVIFALSLRAGVWAAKERTRHRWSVWMMHVRRMFYFYFATTLIFIMWMTLKCSVGLSRKARAHARRTDSIRHWMM